MGKPTKVQMKGLYNKYTIQKSSGKPLAPSFYAIVLRIDGGRYVEACRAGVKAFADAVLNENPKLAIDIQHKLNELLIIEPKPSNVVGAGLDG